MPIRRVLLNDFRAFPGPVDYEFPLDDKSLLLFGENGSGKSSIAIALREFFNRATNAKPFDDFRHVFTYDTAGQPLTTGHVSVEFDDGSVHQWPIGGARPMGAAVAEAALRFVTLNLSVAENSAQIDRDQVAMASAAPRAWR